MFARLVPFIVAVLALVLFHPAMASAKTRIAFINPGLEDEFFWPEVTRTMQAAADQFGFALDVVYAHRDAQRMIGLGLEKIQQSPPPDVLILVNEFQAAPELLRAADEKGIKVFMLLNTFFDAQLPEMGAPGEKYPNWIGSLTPSNEGAGQRMAEMLRRCMIDSAAKGKGQKFHVLALSGDARTPASLERTAGMYAAFSADKEIAVDRNFSTNWQASDGRRQTLNYLNWARAHDVQPAGIWAANDALALGAIDALKAKGLVPGKDVCVVGLNWSPEAVDMVAKGSMAGTDGGHFLAGAWSMVMIADYLKTPAAQRQPVGNAVFEMAAINPGNVQLFLRELGKRDWSRIPFHRFAHTAADCDFSLTRILDFLSE